MTHTLSIDRVSTSVADVSVPQLTQANFRLMSTQRDVASGVTESWYSLPSGDPAYPSTIVVRVAKPVGKNAASGQTRAMIAFNTYARDEDSVTGEVVVRPISTSLNLHLPPMSLEATDLLNLVGNLYGLSFNTLNTKVPDTAVMANLLFGLTEAF